MGTPHDELHAGPYLPHLLIHALSHDLDRPTVHIGAGPSGGGSGENVVLTAGNVRDEISRFAQAFAARGITKGTPVAMLSMNRPEVLYAMGANMVTGCRSTALHPMGSVDDQAYVLADAGTKVLLFDPSLFGERARALQDKVPGLRHLLALGPTEVAADR